MSGDSGEAPRRRFEVVGGRPSDYEIRPRATRHVPYVRCDLDLDLAIDEASRALANNLRIYERSGRLVDVVRGQIRELHVATIREILAASARYLETDRNGRLVPRLPPDEIVAGVAHRGAWGARELRGVSAAPFLRPDGTICQGAGYDEATGILYAPGQVFPAAPDLPTRADAEAALRAVLEPIADFPFKRCGDRSPSLGAFVSLLLTLAIRPAIRGPVPGWIVSANTRGTGKTLLAQVASRIVYGRSVEVRSFSRDEEENRKRITSVLKAGDRLCVFDNVKRAVGGEPIEMAITTETWSDRELGSNSVLSVPNGCVFVFTGNNLTTEQDAARRFVPVDLETRHMRPEDRDDFAIPDLDAWLVEARPRLVVALLTIARAWWAAGRPLAGVRSLGSFEGWSRTIPAMLAWLGCSTPLEAREASAATEDQDRGDLAQLADWWERFCATYGAAEAGATVGGVVRFLWPVDRQKITEESADLRGELETILRATGKAEAHRALVYRLRAAKARIIDATGRRFDAGNMHRGERRWRVIRPEG